MKKLSKTHSAKEYYMHARPVVGDQETTRTNVIRMHMTSTFSQIKIFVEMESFSKACVFRPPKQSY